MICERCGVEINAEFAKVSKGYCEECDHAAFAYFLSKLNSVSEIERFKMRDTLYAEALSRGLI